MQITTLCLNSKIYIFLPVQIFKGNKDIPEQEAITIRNLTSCQSKRISLVQHRTMYICLIRQGIVKQKRNSDQKGDFFLSTIQTNNQDDRILSLETLRMKLDAFLEDVFNSLYLFQFYKIQTQLTLLCQMLCDSKDLECVQVLLHRAHKLDSAQETHWLH